MILPDGTVERPALGSGDPIDVFAAELGVAVDAVGLGGRTVRRSPAELARQALALCHAEVESVEIEASPSRSADPNESDRLPLRANPGRTSAVRMTRHGEFRAPMTSAPFPRERISSRSGDFLKDSVTQFRCQRADREVRLRSPEQEERVMSLTLIGIDPPDGRDRSPRRRWPPTCRSGLTRSSKGPVRIGPGCVIESARLPERPDDPGPRQLRRPRRRARARARSTRATAASPPPCGSATATSSAST